MTDNLRTRIAAALWEELRTQNNLVNFDRLADAVIRELDMGIPCAATGCRMRQIAQRHAQNSSKLEVPDD